MQPEMDFRALTVGELLAGMVSPGQLDSVAARPVLGVTDDSRQVGPDFVFVAVRGTAVDGRRFIPDAIARGALVVVGEALPEFDGALGVNVPDARAALAMLAQRWHGVADAGLGPLKLIGITGTNGKSTSAFMTRAILHAAGMKCGLLGTVHHDLGRRAVKALMTTPGPLELAAYLRECRESGADAAVMEVSSHALDQKRTDGLRFAAAAFTNLSGDHLDYHGTLERYRAAKARLFANLATDAAAVVNRDDPHHAHMVRDCRARVVAFALDREADVSAQITRSTSEGTYYRLRVGRDELVLENALVGRHNVYNALTAAALGHALDIGLDAVAEGLTAVRNIPGRLQRVPCVHPADVFVDYAHTDDALRNVLSVLRPLTSGRLVVVFGCGGDRDRSKRPRMAQAVAAHADRVVITSDNPRTEDPQRIIDDIVAGLEPEQQRAALIEPDRATAIRAALSEARVGDIVLIAGKGHENYQILGSERIHFDDVEVAIQAAAELRQTAAGER